MNCSREVDAYIVKGNLKFPHAGPLPLALIARIVRLRVRQDRANKKGK